MAYPPGMELHGSKWRIVKRVPQDLLSHYAPKDMLRHNTGQSDKKAAAVIGWRWLADLATEFQRIRETGSKYRQEIPEDEAAHLVALMVHSSLQADWESRDSGDYQDDETFEAAERQLEATDSENRAALSRQIFRGDLPLIVEDWLLSHGFNIAPDSEAFRRLCVEFAKGRAEAIRARRARNAGEWVATPPVPVLAPPEAPIEAPRLSELVTHFLGKQDQAAPMYKKFTVATGLLLEVLGDRPVSTIKQREVDEFFELLCRLPPKWSDKKRQLKLGVRDLALMAWPACLNKKTFEDSYMAALRPFFRESRRVFADQGFPVHLTTEGIKYTGSTEGGENKQRPLRADELKRLYEGPEFAAFAKDPKQAHCYWLPLLGLYTGARINEVCQLNPQCDIREEEGVWFLDITEDSETDERVRKSVKNKPSKRRTPIHSVILGLGFLDYARRMKDEGHALLFPQWPPTRGKASGKAEKWFRMFLEDLGLRDETKGKRVVGFHAMRSTFLSRADHLDISKPGTLTGHSQGEGNRDEDAYKAPIELAKNRDKLEGIYYDLSIPGLGY